MSEDAMTEMTPETFTDPVPGAAPAPAPVPQETLAQDRESRLAELEAEMTRLRAEAIADAKSVLRVMRPHVSFTHGGVTVTTGPTPVPARAVPLLLEAAEQAGVKIEEAS